MILTFFCPRHTLQDEIVSGKGLGSRSHVIWDWRPLPELARPWLMSGPVALDNSRKIWERMRQFSTTRGKSLMVLKWAKLLQLKNSRFTFGTKAGSRKYWMLGNKTGREVAGLGCLEGLFPDSFRKNLVPGKWHSGMQTPSLAEPLGINIAWFEYQTTIWPTIRPWVCFRISSFF